jgi:signal transduction histidine kinase/CheY-like chemotaxis protein
LNELLQNQLRRLGIQDEKSVSPVQLAALLEEVSSTYERLRDLPSSSDEDLKAKSEKMIQRFMRLEKIKHFLDETEKLARVGGWQLQIDTQELTWSDQTYRIHEVPVGTPMTVDQAIKFYKSTDAEVITAAIQNTMETGQPYDLKLTITTAKGNEVRVHTVGSITKDEGKPPVLIGAFQDITESSAAMEEKKLLEKQLLQAAKLSSIGQLSAGIAHELNNPLTAVIGFTEVLIARLADAPTNLDMAKKIKKSALRMRDIIKHLRSFSRDSSDQGWVEVPIRKIVDNSLIVLGPQLTSAGIELSVNELVPNIKIVGDPVQIESVFQNLISNSIDQFEDLEVSGKEIVIEIAAEEHLARVTYRDNAGGMPEETLAKVFDPFFTTKDPGKGTGLGMSICHDILTKHGGRISAESVVGHTSTFTILVPLNLEDDVRDKLQVKQVEVGRDSKAKGTSKKVLVIDDEPEICEVLEFFLKDYFEVETTTGSKMALDLISNKEFDLVITDLKMPEVSGLKVIEHTQKNSPSTAVILISGDAKTVDMSIDAMKAGAIGVISKPFESGTIVIDTIFSYLKAHGIN